MDNEKYLSTNEYIAQYPKTPVGEYYSHIPYGRKDTFSDSDETDFFEHISASSEATVETLEKYMDHENDSDDEDLLELLAKKSDKAKQHKPNNDITVKPRAAKPQGEDTPTSRPDLKEAVTQDKGPPITIVALGRTGDGKSSLLNDMMENSFFDAKTAVQSQTSQAREFVGFWAPTRRYKAESKVFGCNVKVVDTPGFLDSEGRDIELKLKTREKIVEIASNEGLNVILLTFKIYASVDIVMQSLRSLSELLHPFDDFWKSVMLVFTHCEYNNREATRENKTIMQTQVSEKIQLEYDLHRPLPMVFLSTKQHICGYIQGKADCDCRVANKWHADSRRRLYDYIHARREQAFKITAGDPEIKLGTDALRRQSESSLSLSQAGKRTASGVTTFNSTSYSSPSPATSPSSQSSPRLSLNSQLPSSFHTPVITTFPASPYNGTTRSPYMYTSPSTIAIPTGYFTAMPGAFSGPVRTPPIRHSTSPPIMAMPVPQHYASSASSPSITNITLSGKLESDKNYMYDELGYRYKLDPKTDSWTKDETYVPTKPVQNPYEPKPTTGQEPRYAPNPDRSIKLMGVKIPMQTSDPRRTGRKV
ncbi:hypothetical protein BZG36_05339 [Bifiguratus adelaidae]|uniref:AIG1-type G domain-containing protein n=1 Tax=Bifiguratus adelaidae TaxID=1938954 RepID=A0A261XU24_9FUNG|nr:hypothetical protein BZG36_05339 [Bifiguratus adelaidae]